MSGFSALDAAEQLNLMQMAGESALHHWGIENAELEALKYRENAVFAVTSGDQRFALRVHRPGYHSAAALKSELQWIAALGETDVEVPRILPTRDGGLSVAVLGQGLPGPVQIDLFEWIDGRQLGSVESGLEQSVESIAHTYRTIGQLAAKLHNHAASWQLPAGFVRHAWDQDGLAGEQPCWGRFWELDALSKSQRRLLSRARERVYRDLSALPKTRATYSMIHADFAPENILVDGDRLRLIDFDDAGFGWHLFELVTSLYFVMDERYFPDARDALVSGYRSQRSLPDEQLQLLPLFFLARSFTYVGWVHTRPGTETARDLTPMLVDASCSIADSYLGGGAPGLDR